jgi:Skp family chaperone for outer membrane proteins
VKTSFRLALASAALLAAAFPVSALAQGGRPAAGAKPAATAPVAHKVGLVDLAYIFSKYKKIEVERKALQKEFEAASPEVQNIQKQLQGIKDQLQSGTVAKGSEKWTALETQFTELSAQGQAKASNLQREFVRKELAIYKEAYEEVSTLVTQYAEAYHYTLILRHQRDPETAETAEDPQAVMNKLNQLVVYHQPTDDITGDVLKVLNDRYLKAHPEAASAAPAAAAGNAPASPVRR